MSPHRTTRVRRDVVVVGASAGGVEALIAFIGALPADLPATVLVVLHVPATGGSALPRILARATSLDVRIARHGEPLEPATVLVAPPDRHLVLRSGRVHLTRGPRENGHRPAVDVLFRSTALAARARTVAVVLSGSLDDGTAGSAAVIRAGGTVLAQDPADALYSGMPASVIRDVGALHMDTATGLGVLVGRLVAEPVEVTDPAHLPPVEEVEVEMAELDAEAMAAHDRPGVPAGFGCPDCGARCSGSTTTRCGTGAASATRGRRKVCWPSSRRPWKARCGWRCGGWRRSRRSAPPSPSGRPSGAACCRRNDSSTRRFRRGVRPNWSGSCCRDRSVSSWNGMRG